MHNRKEARTPAFQTLQLEVPNIGPVHPECAALIVQELLKHFLYMRSQLPLTFDQLLWHYQESKAISLLLPLRLVFGVSLHRLDLALSRSAVYFKINEVQH